MTVKTCLLISMAAVLAVVLVTVVVLLGALTLMMGESIRGEAYTPASLLELLVLVAAAVSAGLLLRSTIRRARHA